MAGKIAALVTLAAGLAVVAASLCLFACSPSQQGPGGPLEKVTITMTAPPYGALMDIAMAKGYLRQEGLEAIGRPAETGKAAIEDVLAGRADIAVSSETPLMFAAMNGAKLAVLATVEHTSRVNAVVARKDRGIRVPEDLKGKRIGSLRGTNLEYFLDIFLTTHGVPPRNVTPVDLKLADMAAALAAGQVDALSTMKPFLNDAQAKLGDRSVTFSAEELYTQSLPLSALPDWIRGNPGRVNKLLRGLLKAEAFLLKDPTEARKVVADFRGLDRSVVDAIWADLTFELALDQSLLLSLEDQSSWALKAKLTKAKQVPNYLNYVYLDGLKAVKPKTVRILK